MESRPSSPSPPPQDLWSSILDSVSSSRSIPSKNVLLLGKPGTGKSTLASAILGKAPPDLGASTSEGRADFALGYDWADVRDEGDEDTLARLSVYIVPSADPAFTSLVPHFLPPRTSLSHTAIVVVLDWTQPWTFVEELEEWLGWIEAWAQGDAKDGRDLEIVREDNRERWQSHLQHYTEPSSDPIAPSSSLSSSTVLPLGPGTLTHNATWHLIDDGQDGATGGLGGGMAAGLGGGMVKGKGGEWEERTDGIMQILRTVCLKYGAALFYTTPLPETLSVMRQYTLHTLFVPPAPSPTGGEAPTRNPFPFIHRPNTLDRDRVVIPAGWDSWGKITVLREFDPKGWGEAWEKDIEGEEANDGARRMFSSLVPDQGTKPPPLPPFNNPTPEQLFLAKNYDENTKKADRDPRGAFRNPTDPEGVYGAGAGIVGPMGTNSFNLPNVEKLFMEMESTAGASNTSFSTSLSDRPERSDRPGRRAQMKILSPTNNSPTNSGGRPPASPSPGVSPTGGGQSQHEVLQNFFQSLLTNKDRPGSAGPRPKSTMSNGSSGAKGDKSLDEEGSS
ncbi:hypothetical protein BT96DRAFT_953209 [Gymnopus androsaceus JB14]|uniref:DLIC-domain-containing protein n=1 Tax=Gymnopus androsaceus JB14 TaxID=1447944 RepID=A0A6A4IN67_9AGAR|nr:hypothetical protein BT96DRAFT_953209 [Gymnopus androsaceus JB14]